VKKQSRMYIQSILGYSIWNGAGIVGRLEEVAFDFHPDYHTLRNALNQVASLRLGITWLVDTKR